MKYQPNTPPSLRGVSFVTRRAERIGVVGRTGAGKSSIGMALFRMVELERQNGGVITIDGYNTSDVGLDTLRHAIRYPPRARVGQLVLVGTAHTDRRVFGSPRPRLQHHPTAPTAVLWHHSLQPGPLQGVQQRRSAVGCPEAGPLGGDGGRGGWLGCTSHGEWREL